MKGFCSYLNDSWRGFGCLQADTSQLELWRWSAPEVGLDSATPSFDATLGDISHRNRNLCALLPAEMTKSSMNEAKESE
jgi:hypothetical protein